jgi:hypothetical protein
MNRVYEFGEYRLDADSRVLQRSSEAIPLTPKCFGCQIKCARCRDQSPFERVVLSSWRKSPSFPPDVY